MELKIWRDGEAGPLAAGLAQLDEYLVELGLDSIWLVIFDQRSGLSPITNRTNATSAATPAGRAVIVVRW